MWEEFVDEEGTEKEFILMDFTCCTNFELL